MGYREDYFKAHKGTKFPLKRGTYYMCQHCHRWFLKSEIDVDHIIPKRKGGTDELYNLQALCRHCNRSKQDHNSKAETVKAVSGAVFTGNALGLAKGVAKRKGLDLLGVKYKRK